MNSVQKGLITLGLKDTKIIKDIYYDIEINKEYIKSLEKEREEKIEYLKRFKIPPGLNKQKLVETRQETLKKIDELSKLLEGANEQTIGFLEAIIEDYNKKVKRVDDILLNHNIIGEKLDVQKARDYPISQLIDFTNGKALCIWHTEKTPSLYLMKEKNKVHCFGGCGTFDSIAIVMQLNNVEFKEAVKILTNK